MENKKKIIGFMIVLVIFFGVVFIKDMFMVDATDTLITVGEMTVTTNTTIEDIEKVLGKPKIKTISAFGGYAYTFYIGSDYENYLYIETTEDDKIISYGSVDKSYSVLGDKNNGSEYEEDTSDLSGYFYTNDENKIIGGIYYNPNVLYDGDTEQIIRLYNNNYDKYSSEYQYGISKHSVAMFNALSRRLGKKINLIYENNYDYYSKYNIKTGMFNYENYQEESYELGVKEGIVFSKMTSSTLNPMHFASLIKGNLDKDYSKNNIAAFNYDTATKILYGYAISEDLLEKMNNYYERDYWDYSYSSFSEIHKFYAISLLDDKMTETEKAYILAQYVQEGIINSNDYGNGYINRYDGYLNKYPASTFNSVFNSLAHTAGLACELLENKKTATTWNMCNLDDEWTYIDITKPSSASYDPQPYQKISFPLIFKGQETMKNNSLSLKYDFSDIDVLNKFWPFFSEKFFPEGKDKEIEEYSSRVYYDDNNKYYEKTENKKTKLYKENRKTGKKEELADVLYSLDGTGLVKDDDKLYFIGIDDSLYSLNLKSLESTKIITINEENKKITGVFLGKDGYIYYGIYDENEEITNVKSLKKISVWPKTKTYISPDNNYKYKITYLENLTSTVLVKEEKFMSEIADVDLNIQDEINGKPVIGIGDGAYQYTNHSGKFIAPKNLQYIGNDAFSSNKYLEGFEFNYKLKSIGGSAFRYDEKVVGSIDIPDSVTYIGDGAFSSCINITNLKLGKGLSYINNETFNNVNFGEKLIIPEGVEYIGSYAFTGNNSVKAVFLPESLREITDYSFSYPEELFIKSKNISYMPQRMARDIYLPTNSKTSQYADKNNIKYYDITDLKQRIDFEYYIRENNNSYKGILTDTLTDNIQLYEYYDQNRDSNENSYTYTIKPRYYFDETKIEWSSDNSDVATVDQNGLITINGAGVSNIKLTFSNGGESTFILRVEGLLMNYNTWQFTNLNQTLKLNVSHSVGWSAGKLSWSSSNDEIATVDQNGLVAPKRGGFVTITATSDYYGSANCLVYISVPIEMSDGSKVYAGDLNKDGVIDKKDLEILKVYISNGNITSDQILLSDINGDGIVDSKDIAQMEKIINNESFEVGEYKPITNIVLDKENLNLAIGATSNLKATITPNDTTDSKELTWKSSNNTVATVDNEGNVTAKANGTVTITVTTSNGKSAKCKVVVGTGKLDYIKGDINRDEVVDVKDAREVLYMAVGMRNITDEDLLIGDMNANKKMESGDAIEILRIYLKKE